MIKNWIKRVRQNWQCHEGLPRIIIHAPERFWRWILGRLWHDRLAFQYERGMEDGLREGLFNADDYRTLFGFELAPLIGCTEEQAKQLLSAMEYKYTEKRKKLLNEINKERGAA